MVLAEFVGSRSFSKCAGSRRARARAPNESVFGGMFGARARARRATTTNNNKQQQHQQLQQQQQQQQQQPKPTKNQLLPPNTNSHSLPRHCRWVR